jgi:dGTPase
MVADLVETSSTSPFIAMSDPVYKAMMDLRAFLFDNVYLSQNAKAEEPRAYGVVRTLFEYYLAHPDGLPVDERPENPADLAQAVCDYVSGMTDRFAIRTFEQLMIPSRWRV